jgi:hypothetical protein
MKAIRGLGLLAVLALTACGGSLPPPDWKMNAQAGLEAYEKHYLEGDSRLAELNFDKARAAIAHSGRLDILARAELARCATRVAALNYDDCPGYQSLAGDAAPAERAYSELLAGRWAGLDTTLLPAQYRGLPGARDDASRFEALVTMKDPQSRLIAAGLLFRQAALPPQGIALAVETASERGWRRPLLTWLRIQAQRAETAGDKEALAASRKRIDLVLGGKPPIAE